MKGSDARRYHDFLESELEAAAMYRSMADAEKDPKRMGIFESLEASELRHAARWAEKLGLDASAAQSPKANARTLLFRLAVKLLGVDRVLPWVARMEAREINVYDLELDAADMAAEERHHARALREMTVERGASGAFASGRALGAGGGGRLRAAVLGMNDGLVSNFSLVMGVAGGSGNPDFVLLAGIAGLLAGAFSMAAGEYVSMRSQRDVYEYKIGAERVELEEWPEEEEEELALIYEAKGLPRDEAERVARRIMERPSVALDTMAREELGLNPDDLGSPWGAAASSFAAFVLGAIVPILPYLLDVGEPAFILSAALSGGALAVVGGALALVTSRNAAWGAMRMLAIGGAAAAVTYGIGRLIGVSILG